MTGQPVELVITAPEPYGASLAYQTRCRTTLGVLSQLLAQAKNRVIIAAPFISPSKTLVDGALANAIRSSLQRGVEIDFLSTKSSLEAVDWELYAADSSSGLRLFQPSANLMDERKLGSHAKFCVADGKSAYVGSANLTGPGLSSQLELGVLVHGKIASEIEQFWDSAVEQGIFICIT